MNSLPFFTHNWPLFYCYTLGLDGSLSSASSKASQSVANRAPVKAQQPQMSQNMAHQVATHRTPSSQSSHTSYSGLLGDRPPEYKKGLLGDAPPEYLNTQQQQPQQAVQQVVQVSRGKGCMCSRSLMGDTFSRECR